METVRILIADDHPLFRKGMRALLAAIPEVEIVGEAATGAEAIALADTLEPDVILMDLQMPDGGGIAATRRIVGANSHIRILVVTLFEDDDSVFAALRAGARGYILKDTDEDEMLRAVRAIGQGEAIFSPAIAKRMIDFFGTSHTPSASAAFPELTEREREILDLIARGVNNADIAAQLTISLKTVRNNVSNIYNKLQVADRVQAMLRAREAGLGEGRR